MANAEPAWKDNRSALERVLSVMAETHPGEGVTAVMLTVTVFLLMTAYYVIKPVREGLILAMPDGAEKKSYVAAAIAFALLFAVPAYARVASKVAKNKLVVGVTLFFASNLVLFFFCAVIPSVKRELGLIFFTWVGVFNMMVIAQFWGFAADIYTQEQGKRLFAIVGFGGSMGATVGAYITHFLKRTIGLSILQLMLVAAGILVLAAFLTQIVHAREQRLGRSGDREAKKAADAAEKKRETEKADQHPQGAYTLVAKNKYLLLIAAFSLVYTIVDTNGEYILSTLVEGRAHDAATAQNIVDPAALDKFVEGYIASYYASFYLWVNLIGTSVQTFLVSRIIKYGGLKVGFLIYPFIALGSSLNAIFIPTIFGIDRLTAFRPTKTAENATDYSLNATARNMLWLPTTTEMKYKAKQVIDAFCVRMGDVFSAGLVFLFGATLKWPVRNFSMINVLLVALWLFLALGILRENARLSEQKERESQPPKATA